jgi:hypothetical protein
MGAEDEEIVETQASPAISARASRTGEIESLQPAYGKQDQGSLGTEAR